MRVLAWASLVGSIIFATLPSSTHYKLQSFGVNSGGTNNSASSTYQTQATAGGLNGNASVGTTYMAKTGSIQSQQAQVPGAPTLDNGGGTYFNKLKFIIDNSANPSDATFAVAVATTSNFATTYYVQADGTLGSAQVYQDYTSWGGAAGSYAIGLAPNTTYWFKASAQEGQFTASAFGPSANIATSEPALSFSVSQSTVTLGNLSSGSIITSSPLSLGFSTNAANGGSIYMSGVSSGLVSASNGGYSLQVNPPSADLSSINEGFGLQAVTNGSLVAQPPYVGPGNTVGAIYTTFQPVFTAAGAVSSGSANTYLLAKSQLSTPAGDDYTDTLTFIAAAAY